jgi:Rrf2 family protein
VISQTAEYALRAVVFLAGQEGRPATTERIAADTKVPAGYLAKVLQALGRAGLVEARRGLHGGYILTRSLDDLTVLDVVNAVDPLKRINHCPLGLATHRGRLCSLHSRIDEAIGLVERFFRETTVAQLLAERGTRHRPLCEVVPSARPPVSAGAGRAR